MTSPEELTPEQQRERERYNVLLDRIAYYASSWGVGRMEATIRLITAGADHYDRQGLKSESVPPESNA